METHTCHQTRALLSPFSGTRSSWGGGSELRTLKSWIFGWFKSNSRWEISAISLRPRDAPGILHLDYWPSRICSGRRTWPPRVPTGQTLINTIAYGTNCPNISTALVATTLSNDLMKGARRTRGFVTAFWKFRQRFPHSRLTLPEWTLGRVQVIIR